ncbi:MAG: GNAT family N-acetyltransferase [Rhodospirillaceae bacterium]
MDDEFDYTQDNISYIDRTTNSHEFEYYAQDYAVRRGLDYRFLRSFRDYQAAYSGSVVLDASFLVQNQGTTVGFVYAPIERRGDALSVSIGGGYIPAPVFDDHVAEIAAFTRLDKIAREMGVEKVLLHASLADQWGYNHLITHGYVDTSVLDSVIDLKLHKDDLWRKLRRRYRSMINKISEKNGYSIIIVDAKSPDHSLHETYRHLHEKCSGRVTRAKDTFDIQYQMLTEGNASIFVLKKGDDVYGSIYFLHHGVDVDYMSMADDPEFSALKLPISHVLIWAAACHFQASGFHRLRLSSPAGFSLCEGFGAYSDLKALGIAHFKHGMASDTVMYFRGNRYYNKLAAERDLRLFEAALAQQLVQVIEEPD